MGCLISALCLCSDTAAAGRAGRTEQLWKPPRAVSASVISLFARKLKGREVGALAPHSIGRTTGPLRGLWRGAIDVPFPWGKTWGCARGQARGQDDPGS